MRVMGRNSEPLLILATGIRCLFLLNLTISLSPQPHFGPFEEGMSGDSEVGDFCRGQQDMSEHALGSQGPPDCLNQE